MQVGDSKGSPLWPNPITSPLTAFFGPRKLGSKRLCCEVVLQTPCGDQGNVYLPTSGHQRTRMKRYQKDCW